MQDNEEVVAGWTDPQLVAADPQNESYCPNIVCCIPYHRDVAVGRGAVAAVDVVVGSFAVDSSPDPRFINMRLGL